MHEGSALKYDLTVDPESDGSHGKLARLVGHHKRVLDLGCGTGALAQLLVTWGCTVTGVEFDPTAAKLAEEHCDRVIVGDLDLMDLEEAVAGETFDVVVAGDVLEHLRDPGRVVRQAASLLRPEGHLAVSVPNVAHGSVRLAVLHGSFPYAEKGLLDRTHLQFLTRDSLRDLLDDNGFRTVRMDEVLVGVEDTEVPYPDDALTAAVLNEVKADPSALVYQYVALAFPSGPLSEGGVPGLIAEMEDQLLQTRDHARQWELRGTGAETSLRLRNESLAEEREVNLAAAEERVAPIRQELLVTKDQLAHRDHDVRRVMDLYGKHTAALQHVERERAALRTELTDTQVALEETRGHLYASIEVRDQLVADMDELRRIMELVRGNGAHEVDLVKAELAEIKSSRLWDVATRYRTVRHSISGLRRR